MKNTIKIEEAFDNYIIVFDAIKDDIRRYTLNKNIEEQIQEEIKYAKTKNIIYDNDSLEWVNYFVNRQLKENPKKYYWFWTNPNPKKIENIKTYIMKDFNNNLYKIGRSKNPKLREKTLQSEKPSIKIIKVFDKNIEKELHKKYEKQRIRGEWFNLNNIQIKYICTHY